MHYRRLGSAGMKVSALGFGGWINYGEGKVAEDEARRIVEYAYEHGVNYFDLADIYGYGKAEEQMGAVLRQFPRHTLVIATKVFWAMSNDVNDRGLSRKHIFESIDKSLKRLGTDYVDIYFCHRPDPETPMIETIRAMDDLIRMGKVLYWGTSVWSGAQLREAYALCERYGLYPPQVEQPQYSMLYRHHFETDILPTAAQLGVGLVLWSPLAFGMLTGKYDEGVPADSRFAREDWAKERMMTEENVQRVRNLKPIADELGVSRAQLALAWVLTRGEHVHALPGTTRVTHLLEDLGAPNVQPGADVLAQLDAVFA
ncbi:MAG: aldo/keto reductase family protein, partial [Aggregatilineales bacterium]